MRDYGTLIDFKAILGISVVTLGYDETSSVLSLFDLQPSENSPLP